MRGPATDRVGDLQSARGEMPQRGAHRREPIPLQFACSLAPAPGISRAAGIDKFVENDYRVGSQQSLVGTCRRRGSRHAAKSCECPCFFARGIEGAGRCRRCGSTAAAPEPEGVDRQRAAGLTRLVHRMFMQKHLQLVQPVAKHHRVIALRLKRFDVAPDGDRQRCGREPGCSRQPQIPALWMERMQVQLRAEMTADRRRQFIRLLARECDGSVVGQCDAVAHQRQVHGIRAQPVSAPSRSAVRFQCDRCERPVLLACDAERPAQGCFDAVCGV